MTKPAWYRSRRLKIALVAVIATLVGVGIGVDIWSKSRVRAFAKASAPAWDAERARLESLDNPTDPTVKDPCAPAYLAVGVDLGASGRAIGLALRRSLKEKVPDDARAIVAGEKGAIDAFLKASRCGKYTPKPDEAWVTYGRLYPFFIAGRLVIVDARVRAEEGDLDASLDRLLAAIKAGTDLEQGTLMASVHGVAVSAPALETLAALIAEGRLSEAQRDRVERLLLALAPRMPSMEDGILRQRLILHQIATEALATGKAPANARPSADNPGRFVAAVLPPLAILADALWKQDRFLARVQDFARDDRDPLLFVTRMANAEPRAKSRVLTGFDFPPYGLMQKGHNLCIPRAWTKMILTALTVEKAPSVPASLPPMDDPCGAGSLLYFTGATGGYVLASTGKDGTISDDDLRLERAPKPAPPAL
ncbi:MAG: hypothetical protein U0441_39195 [Polyangiaceae bacterium]